MDNQEIYSKAALTWGISSQLNMLIEEMAELMVEVRHIDRGIDSPGLPGEVADVEIMLEQLKYILAIEKDVETIKELKINRLKKMLSEA